MSSKAKTGVQGEAPNIVPIQPNDNNNDNNNKKPDDNNDDKKKNVVPGSVGAGDNKQTPQKIDFFEKNVKHIFRDKEGHFREDTPENRKLLLDMVNNKENLLGPDEHNNQWYGRITEDGKQIWAQVWDGEIRNAGINDIPQPYNPETGLSRQFAPRNNKTLNDKFKQNLNSKSMPKSMDPAGETFEQPWELKEEVSLNQPQTFEELISSKLPWELKESIEFKQPSTFKEQALLKQPSTFKEQVTSKQPWEFAKQEDFKQPSTFKEQITLKRPATFEEVVTSKQPWELKEQVKFKQPLTSKPQKAFKQQEVPKQQMAFQQQPIFKQELIKQAPPVQMAPPLNVTTVLKNWNSSSYHSAEDKKIFSSQLSALKNDVKTLLTPPTINPNTPLKDIPMQDINKLIAISKLEKEINKAYENAWMHNKPENRQKPHKETISYKDMIKDFFQMPDPRDHQPLPNLFGLAVEKTADGVVWGISGIASGIKSIYTELTKEDPKVEKEYTYTLTPKEMLEKHACEMTKKSDQKNKDCQFLSPGIKDKSVIQLPFLNQCEESLKDLPEYQGDDLTTLGGYYAAHSATILNNNPLASTEELKNLLNNRDDFEQCTLLPGKNIINFTRPFGENSDLSEEEIGKIILNDSNEKIIINNDNFAKKEHFEKDANDFKSGKRGHIAFILNDENQWFSALVRKNKETNQPEIIIADSLGKDRCNSSEQIKNLFKTFMPEKASIIEQEEKKQKERQIIKQNLKDQLLLLKKKREELQKKKGIKRKNDKGEDDPSKRRKKNDGSKGNNTNLDGNKEINEKKGGEEKGN